MENYYRKERRLAEDRLDFVLTTLYRIVDEDFDKKEFELRLKAIK